MPGFGSDKIQQTYYLLSSHSLCNSCPSGVNQPHNPTPFSSRLFQCKGHFSILWWGDGCFLSLGILKIYLRHDRRLSTGIYKGLHVVPVHLYIFVVSKSRQCFKAVKMSNGITLWKWPCSWCRAWWLGQNFLGWPPLPAPCCDQCSSAQFPGMNEMHFGGLSSWLILVCYHWL